MLSACWGVPNEDRWKWPSWGNGQRVSQMCSGSQQCCIERPVRANRPFSRDRTAPSFSQKPHSCTKTKTLADLLISPCVRGILQSNSYSRA